MGTEQRTQRLCSEIQLFDLCDLEACGHKDGRFCTKGEILERFEAIKEEDERSPEQYLTEDLEEVDEVEELDDMDFDEAFSGDGDDDDEQ